jgi:hypothetical protein
MIQIDDLVEPRAKHVRLPAVPTLFRPHSQAPIRPSTTRESRLEAQLNLQDNRYPQRNIRQNRILENPRKPLKSGRLSIFHGRLYRMQYSVYRAHHHYAVYMVRYTDYEHPLD